MEKGLMSMEYRIKSQDDFGYIPITEDISNYEIVDYMYSNSTLAGSEKTVSATGYLKTSGWNRHQTVTAENMVDAGREIFRGQCSSCHSIGGPMKDIRKYTAGIGVMGLEALISGMGKVYEYMPVFVGTRQERTALATYLAREINGQTETSGEKHPVQPEWVLEKRQ